MISTQNISLRYGERALFENVSVKFTDGNCYGIIGANGAGKSTFLKILSGEIEANKGEVVIESGKRLSMLKQDQFAYEENGVIETVIMGNKRLYEITKEKEVLYAKPDFNDEDGIRLGELEGEFADMDGWNAEVDAEILLNGLGVTTEFHDLKMKELDGQQKVKVLL
ncbi:MAG: ATP-binding cassette domain-containing protein, partial [Coprobacillaceae bacterium]